MRKPMRTKTAITATELTHLRWRMKAYRDSQAVQTTCTLDVAELLGCDLDDAVDLLNRSDTAEQLLSDNGLEIAPDDKPQLRVVDYADEDYGSIDSLTILVGCGMLVAFVGVLWLVGRGFEWIWEMWI